MVLGCSLGKQLQKPSGSCAAAAAAAEMRKVTLCGPGSWEGGDSVRLWNEHRLEGPGKLVAQRKLLISKPQFYHLL